MMSVDIDLKHLSEEKTRHGRRVIYVRRAGKRIRLVHPVGSPEFLTEYRLAVDALFKPAEPAPPKPDQIVRAAANTFGWLVLRYLNESLPYRAMKPAGRRRRRAILEAMTEKHRDRAMILPKDRIAAGVMARMDRPSAAAEWLKALKALYSWANGVGLITVNPAQGIVAHAPETDGFHTWSMEEIVQYLTRHKIGTMAHLAGMILLFTGLRRSDAIRFGRQHNRSGTIRFKTSKTGAELATQTVGMLSHAIDAMPATTEMAYLLNGWGKAFASGNAFGNWFRDRCIEAGLPHCTAHGLRKGGATIAAENGASEVELEAMYGWGNYRQSGVYTKAARNLVLASTGFERIEKALIKHFPSEQSQIKSVAP